MEEIIEPIYHKHSRKKRKPPGDPEPVDVACPVFSTQAINTVSKERLILFEVAITFDTGAFLFAGDHSGRPF